MSDLLPALRAALGDRFRIERELSGAGMSRVFVAEELALGRRVVLKVLPPDAAATVNADRFRREVQFAAKLQHPHIVPVLSTGEDAGTLWYAMPFVDGDTLRARLAKGSLDVRDVVSLWKQMVDALDHAHRAGVVHRDMKPENVLVSGRHVLITDFGIAKAVASATESSATSGLTGIGFVIGTPAYMAPEQAAGMEQVDARADIYSTALIAYEMLTGRAAFGGMTPPQTLAAQVQTMPAAPRSLRADVNVELDALLMQCLAKDPAQRPESADVVLQSLDRIEAGVTTTPSGRAPATAPTSGGRVRRFAIPVAAIVVASAGLLLYLARDQRNAGNAPRDLVVVASFVHEASDSSVARALSEAFRIDLQQSPRLRVAEPLLVRTTLRSMRLDPKVLITDSIAQLLGVRVGAKAYVTGALAQLGGGYVITARLVSVKDGKEVAALRETATSASTLLEATDRLSKALREKAGESVASLRASPALPVATTASLEALERYAAGIALMREGNQIAALGQLEKAVAIDSMFASAWSGMGTVLANLGIRPGDRQRASAKAYALREKLPELERLRLESRYHAARGEVDEEIASLRRILEIDPLAYASLNNLGRLMYGRKQYAAAESLLKAASHVQPSSFTPVDMLYAVAIETGNVSLLDSLKRVIPAGPAGDQFRWSVGEYEQVHRGNYPELARKIDSALATKPDLEMKGVLLNERMYVWFAQGQLKQATMALRDEVAPMVRNIDSAVVPGVELSLAQMRSRFFNDNAGARRLIASADSFYERAGDPEDRALLQRAWAHATAGDADGARKLLAQLTPLLPKDTSFLHFIQGEIALTERRAPDAIKLISRTIGTEVICEVCGLGGLARAYDAAGQKDSVLAVYTRLLDSRSTNGRMFEDAFERAQGLKRSGELLEERGDTKGALARYRQFVELWKDADPELQPVVQDVRERIAKLEGRRG